MAESRWMELYVSIRLYRACIDPKPRLEPVGDRLEWMAEWINEWVCARPGEWMNCNLFWICRQSAKSWLPLPLPMPQPSPAPWAVIWFTFFFSLYFFYLFCVAFWKEFTWERRRAAATKCWPDVRLRFFLSLEAAAALSACLFTPKYSCLPPPVARADINYIIKANFNAKINNTDEIMPRSAVAALVFCSLPSFNCLFLPFSEELFGFHRFFGDILWPQFPLHLPQNIPCLTFDPGND